VAYYEKSIRGYEKIDDNHGLAQACHNLAMAYVAIKDWEQAGKNYQRSMEICLEIGDLDFLSVIYINRAQLALEVHDPSVARVYCDKAFEILGKTDNKLAMAEIFKIYGIIHRNMKEWDSAANSFQKGIELCEEYDNKLTKAEIHYELGAMSHKRSEKKGALSNFRKAIELYEAMGVDNEARRIRDELQSMAV
jgi:tetratricopeptide (TPR) repeat protein